MRDGDDLLVWRVLGLEKVGCHNTGGVGDSNHATRTECCTSGSNDGSSSVGNERNDSSIGTSNHEHSNVSATNTGYGSQEDVSNRNKDQSADDMLSFRQPIVLDRYTKHTAGRSLFLSECHALPMITKKANALGGTVRSCASSTRSALSQAFTCSNLQPRKPRLAMIVGAKKPNAFKAF
jgi:hypothetical protein